MSWDWWDTLICAIVLGLLTLIIVGLIAVSREDDRLMKQCMQDHKEYECRDMLKDRSSTTAIVPVFVPTR